MRRPDMPTVTEQRLAALSPEKQAIVERCVRARLGRLASRLDELFWIDHNGVPMMRDGLLAPTSKRLYGGAVSHDTYMVVGEILSDEVKALMPIDENRAWRTSAKSANFVRRPAHGAVSRNLLTVTTAAPTFGDGQAAETRLAKVTSEPRRDGGYSTTVAIAEPDASVSVRVTRVDVVRCLANGEVVRNVTVEMVATDAHDVLSSVHCDSKFRMVRDDS